MSQHGNKIDEMLAKCNLKGGWKADEPLAEYCTFRTGGPADVLVFPESVSEVCAVRKLAREQGLEVTLLGRGANLLISDQGIRGITLGTSHLTGWSHNAGLLTLAAGMDVSEAARIGRDNSFSCLEFLNAMPSTVGGAVWMNARCYGAEIASVVESVDILDEDNQLRTIGFEAKDWSYKLSPFQGKDWIIVAARFRTRPMASSMVEGVMTANEKDRTDKGHFRAPCAGSVFKNNHAFGAPSGVLIDRCGLKGLRCGKAVVSAWHANIIVNEGGALAADIRSLIDEVKARVYRQTGFLLEEEVLYSGQW
ncbi:MAG: UDP-N-acetylmuramate dehydrogenase [Spirochaetales bacterium]